MARGVGGEGGAQGGRDPNAGGSGGGGGPTGGGTGWRDPVDYSRMFYPGAPKPVWGGGRAGNPTQFQQSLAQWRQAQQPMQAQAAVKPNPIAVPPTFVPQMFLGAAPGYGVMRPGYQFMGPGTSRNTAPVALNQGQQAMQPQFMFRPQGYR